MKVNSARETVVFLSLSVPLNYPWEMESVCKLHCDKDKLLSLFLPAPEVQVGKSLVQT